MRSSIVLLVLVGALAMLEVGAIKCYECNPKNFNSTDPDCKNPITKECSANVTGCIKGAGKDQSGLSGVSKSCAYGQAEKEKDYCGDVELGYLCYCKSDLCNGGEISKPSFNHSASSDSAAHKGSSGTATVPSLGLFGVLLFVLA
ncbi:hypothetical protein M3Y95_01005300 [Aphelenchoides besseyi]|nr:hypothetical protein M3Y95_01005300 [Aphelenchoides besseyi]